MASDKNQAVAAIASTGSAERPAAVIVAQGAESSSESSLPVRLVQKLLLKSHEVTGLPWWATIALNTIIFRASLVPLAVMQVKTARKMFSGAAPAMFAHLTTLTTREIKNAKNDVMKQREALKQYFRGVYLVKRKNNIHLWKLASVPIAQLSAFVIYVSATRDLINQNVARDWGMHQGGTLWFQDLTITDKTYILPLTAVGLTYISIERGWSFAPMVRNFLQTGLVISSAFVFSQMPAGVFMYWIPSAAFGLIQSTAFSRLAALATRNVAARQASGGAAAAAAAVAAKPSARLANGPIAPSSSLANGASSSLPKMASSSSTNPATATLPK